MVLAGPQLPDIVLQTRLDENNSPMFIEQARSVIMNNGFSDPYRYQLKKPIEFSLDEEISEASSESQEWLRELQDFLKIKLFESSYDLQINDLSYDITDYDVKLKASRENNGFNFTARNLIYRPRLSASSIKFIVSLNRSGNYQPISFEIALVRPFFHLNKEASVDISMSWGSLLANSGFDVHFKEVDLTKLFLDLSDDPESYVFDWEDLIVPDLRIKIGSKTVIIDQEKVKNYIRSRREEFKFAIIDLIVTEKKLKAGEKFLIKPDVKFSIPRQFGFHSDINGEFLIEKDELISTYVIRHELTGVFCLPVILSTGFGTKTCEGLRKPLAPRRQITQEQHTESLKMFSELFEQRHASIGLSVSEDYINRLLRTIVEGGLFNMNGKEFSLGPQKAFALSDKKGDEFSLFVDIVYKTEPGLRLLLGKKELRFPVKLMAKLSIEHKDEIPFLMIDISRDASTDDLLRHGLPKFGLESNLRSSRFKKKVIKAIKKEVADFVGKRLVEVNLKELKGSYLENMQFIADGQGRAMAIVKLTR